MLMVECPRILKVKSNHASFLKWRKQWRINGLNMKLRQARPILSLNATFFPYGYVIYNELVNREDFPRARSKTPDSKKGENKHQHGLSDASMKKIKRALNMLAYIADEKPLYPDDPNCTIFFKINSVMLSLPSRQIHSDEFIKSKILDPFIKSCKFHFGMENYFWKAEAQDNGNIHFHLESDCYMDKDKLRHLWNHQLDRYGYIQAYREQQTEKHKDGFYYAKEQYKLDFKTKNKIQIDYQTQKNAYEKGVAHNWSDPNSTDIHSVVDVNNLAAYLCEYLAKKDLWKKSISKSDADAIKRMEKDNCPLAMIQALFPDCVKRSISGNVWNCSKKLKNTGMKIVDINQYRNEFDQMLATEVEKVINTPYCTVYIKKKEFQKSYPSAISELVSDHYCLMKYDCCSIPKHNILLQNEKALQEHFAANNRSRPTTSAVQDFQKCQRLRKLGRRSRQLKRRGKSQFQFRF